MPNREQLQHQLDEFRSASRNLQLLPLITPKDLAKFGVPYSEDLLDELESAVEDCTPGNDKIIFTGHRGCGKSTLLAELTNDRLFDRYFVVLFSISDTIEQSAVDHVNILFSMAVQLLEAAERRSIKLNPKLKKSLYQWLGKHTQTESQAVEAELEVSGTASAGVGLEGILKFLAAIKGKLKANSVVREEITTEFARKISDLIDKIDEIKAYIQSATKQEVLVIIDDLDKLDLSVVDRVFRSNIQPLLQPSFRIIYTIPIATLREVALKRNIEAYVDKIHTMRVAKFFSKAAVRKPERLPNAELMEIFGEIIAKRLPNSLIDLEVKPQIILKSGGVLRELIRIADRSCHQCMTELRRQIRRQEFDKPLVKIDRGILDTVLTDLQLEYAEPLGQKDYDWLAQLYDEMKPQDAENQRFLDLFHTLYVLEYRNAQLWYDLNPIVADLLRQEGSLDDIAP